MEKIVLGLSKSVVEGTVSKVKSAIDEEEKLKLSVQSDLVFITGEFEIMQSFLNVADAGRIKNNAVKTWVRQLRDLAYDTEDCVELVVHLDPKPIWVRRFVVKLFCLSSVALPIDEAAAEIKQLKERVEYVSQRNMRYNLITDVGGGGGERDAAAAGTSSMSALHISAVKAARQQKKKTKKDSKARLVVDLTNLITTRRTDHREVISVWGTAGDLGMTSIIRKAYDDPETCASFKHRGWAKLSTHPFNLHEILRSLLLQFCANSSSTPREEGLDSVVKMEAKVATQADLVSEFARHVKDHRYLVVLEGLSTMAEWDTLRVYLPDMGNQSKIVVSTQHFDIAGLCAGQPYNVSELRKFTAEHSVYVFFKEVSDGDQASNSLGYKEARLIGRETQQRELREQIIHDSRVISVWGTAGVGKSALVRAAYSEYISELNPDTSYIHGWVTVPHPFDLRELCHSLILNLSSAPATTKEKARSDLENMSDPVDVFRDLLSNAENKFLIVIDDLRSAEQWDTLNLKLKFGKKCCIIVVTNEARVAKHCSSAPEELVFNVKGLDDEQAFQLFKQEFIKEEFPILLNGNREEEAKLIVNKCGGLPKVIVAIGGLLPRKLDLEAINEAFIHHLETNPELASVRGLFRWLDSYFHRCPDFLKPCIFYLSIFPRGQDIRRRRLVRRWIAEGYSRDTDGTLAQVNGETYFSQLVDLSMLQQPRHHRQSGHGRGAAGSMSMCCINDFFREYIVSRRMEEDHVFALQGSCSQTTRRTGRHLVIEQSWDRDENVFDKVDFSRLRSMTVFGEWKPFFTSDKMRVVRVLDLEGTTEGLGDADIKLMIKRLPRLKFLSLRKCKGITRLPNSLGRLRQLETLDVRHTAIAALPKTITKLKKLQYVRAGGTSPSSSPSATACCSSSNWLPSCLTSSRSAGSCVIGVDVHKGLGKLTNLHTVGVINVTGAGLNELKKLTQLRRLGVSGINPTNSKQLWSFVSGHRHLESLSVWLHKDLQGGLELDGIDSAPEKLETLKIHGHAQREVDLRVASAADSLKLLRISCSSKWTVAFEEGAVKNLASLHFRCDGLSSLELSGLDHLKSIKDVLLQGTYDDVVVEALQAKIDNHSKIIDFKTVTSDSPTA